MPLFVTFIGMVTKSVSEEDNIIHVLYNGENRDKTFIAEVKFYGKQQLEVGIPIYVAGPAIFKQGCLFLTADVLTVIKDKEVGLCSPIFVCNGIMESKSAITVEQYLGGENNKFSVQVVVRENLKVAKYLKQGTIVSATFKYKAGLLEIQQVFLQKNSQSSISASELLKEVDQGNALNLTPNFVTNESEDESDSQNVPDNQTGQKSKKRNRGKDNK
jgi:hypothetical protein